MSFTTTKLPTSRRFAVEPQEEGPLRFLDPGKDKVPREVLLALAIFEWSTEVVALRRAELEASANGAENNDRDGHRVVTIELISRGEELLWHWKHAEQMLKIAFSQSEMSSMLVSLHEGFRLEHGPVITHPSLKAAILDSFEREP